MSWLVDHHDSHLLWWLLLFLTTGIPVSTLGVTSEAALSIITISTGWFIASKGWLITSPHLLPPSPRSSGRSYMLRPAVLRVRLLTSFLSKDIYKVLSSKGVLFLC